MISRILPVPEILFPLSIFSGDEGSGMGGGGNPLGTSPENPLVLRNLPAFMSDLSERSNSQILRGLQRGDFFVSIEEPITTKIWADSSPYLLRYFNAHRRTDDLKPECTLAIRMSLKGREGDFPVCFINTPQGFQIIKGRNRTTSTFRVVDAENLRESLSQAPGGPEEHFLTRALRRLMRFRNKPGKP